MQVYNELAAVAAAANGGGAAAAAAALRARPPGLTATLAAIVRDEGLVGVMRGVTPSMLREATYRCVEGGLAGPPAEAGTRCSRAGCQPCVRMLCDGPHLSFLSCSLIAAPFDMGPTSQSSRF